MGDFEGPSYIALPYEVFCEKNLFRFPNVIRLDRVYKDGMSEDPLSVNICKFIAGSSGRGAINLAYLWRGNNNKVLLFGFDGGPIEKGHPTHWCRESNHGRWGKNRMVDMEWCYRDAHIKCKSVGMEIINASPGTQIETFPVATHDEVLP